MKKNFLSKIISKPIQTAFYVNQLRLFSFFAKSKIKNHQLYRYDKSNFSEEIFRKLLESGEKEGNENLENKTESIKNYFKIVNFINQMKNSFNLENFIFTVDFLIDNDYMNNQPILKDLYQIFQNNIDKLDSSVKTKMICFLSKKVVLETLSYVDSDWIKIFNDFFVQKSIPIEDFYNSISALDGLVKYLQSMIKGKKNQEFEFSKYYSKFISKDINKVFNLSISITTIEDIIVFSKLVHFKLIKMQSVDETVYYNINKVILINKDQIILKSGLILPCILILHQELNGVTKSKLVFQEAINVINDYLFMIYTNYELLEQADKDHLQRLSDSIFYYCHRFMEKNDFSLIFKKVVLSYYNRIKKEHITNWLNEIQMLQIIAIDLKYNNKSFWDEVFSKLKFFLISEFDEAIKKQITNSTKRLTYDKYEKDKKNKDALKKKLSKQDDLLQNISGLFYIGLLIEIASTVEVNSVHWEYIISALKRNANFKERDLFFNLQFISFYCKELYTNPNLEHIWNNIIHVFDPKLGKIFKDASVVEFFINTAFKMTSLTSETLSMILNKIFTEETPKEVKKKSNDEKDVFLSFEEEMQKGLSKSLSLELENELKNDLEENNESYRVFDELDPNEWNSVYKTKSSVSPKKAKKVKISESNNQLHEPKVKTSKISNIELFCAVYELIYPIIIETKDETCEIIMGNTFVDLLRYENSFLVGTQIKHFASNIKIGDMEKFKDIVFTRLKGLVISEPEDPTLPKLTIMLYKSELINELDISRLLFVLERSENYNPLYKILKNQLQTRYNH
jgi:hypothetical protein